MHMLICFTGYNYYYNYSAVNTFKLLTRAPFRNSSFTNSILPSPLAKYNAVSPVCMSSVYVRQIQYYT